MRLRIQSRQAERGQSRYSEEERSKINAEDERYNRPWKFSLSCYGQVMLSNVWSIPQARLSFKGSAQ